MGRIYVNLIQLSSLIPYYANVASDTANTGLQLSAGLPAMPASVDATVRADLEAARVGLQRSSSDLLSLATGLRRVATLFELASKDKGFRPKLQRLDNSGYLPYFAQAYTGGSGHGEAESPSATILADVTGFMVEITNGKLEIAAELLDNPTLLKVTSIVGKGGKVLAIVGIIATAGNQLYKDWGDPTLTDKEVALRTALLTETAIGSMAAGGLAGGAVGSAVPVAGTAVGAIAGATVGLVTAIASEKADEAYLSHLHDQSMHANDLDDIVLTYATLQIQLDAQLGALQSKKKAA